MIVPEPIFENSIIILFLLHVPTCTCAGIYSVTY